MEYNKVMIAGNLTDDPKVKQLPTSRIANLVVAVNRTWKAADGKREQSASFVSVTCLGKNAEFAQQWLCKGSPVFIEGRLQEDRWENADGAKRSKLIVVAERIVFTERKKQTDVPEWHAVPSESSNRILDEDEPPF